mmetsp:Transcript_3600/g.10355  ORF Transcript_3600/g.10355 Transcript_3600/m.10355 type:complete len:353 (+) Transcript_3600:631-1689(+)
MHLCPVLPGVGHMGQHARRHLEPPDGLPAVVRGVKAAEPKPQAVVQVKREWQLALLHHYLWIKHNRCVEDDGVVLCDGKVVHHYRLGHSDGDRLDEVPLCVNLCVGAVGRSLQVVAEEVHVARGRVDLGVGGEAGLALENEAPGGLDDAVTQHVDGVGEVALVESQQAAGVEGHGSVGGAAAAAASGAGQPCYLLGFAQQQCQQPCGALHVTDLQVAGPASCVLLLVAVGLHPAVGIEDFPALYAAGMDLTEKEGEGGQGRLSMVRQTSGTLQSNSHTAWASGSPPCHRHRTSGSRRQGPSAGLDRCGGSTQTGPAGGCPPRASRCPQSPGPRERSSPRGRCYPWPSFPVPS